MNWQETPVLVTGGASFIGSHIVDGLVRRGAKVRVADNFSSGKRAHLTHTGLDVHEVDLLDADACARACENVEVVFHLAADHGGRGYIDLHQVACSTNLILDGNVFRAAAAQGVGKVVYASSGCVYPNHLQTNPKEEIFLREPMVGPPYDSDNLYGWAKLMGEMTLREYVREKRFDGVSLRYFTAYGPRCSENHAVMAMIARAHVEQDPFVIWGTGEQIRNWTHVDDVAEGTIVAAEKASGGAAYNLGTMERTRVVDAAKKIIAYMGKDLRLSFDPSKPTGPYNRVSDNAAAAEALGWSPGVSFDEGLTATIDWYVAHHPVDEVRANLEHRLTERT